METRTDLTCTVCRRHRAQLRPRKSKLLPGRTLFLCTECFDGKREPRWAVIVTARSEGVEAVRPWIRNRRYYGDKITLDELV